MYPGLVRMYPGVRDVPGPSVRTFGTLNTSSAIAIVAAGIFIHPRTSDNIPGATENVPGATMCTRGK